MSDPKKRYVAIDPCSCDGIADAVASAIKTRRRRRRPFTGLDDLSKSFRRSFIRNFFLTVPADGTRIELVPENPFRTALHCYVPVLFAPVELFLHRSFDSGLEGIPFAQIGSGETYSPDCFCLSRMVQGEWCVRLVTSPALDPSFIFVHEVISVPKRGQGEG